MIFMKSKITFNVFMLIITLFFIIISILFLLNYMIEYKYHIDHNIYQDNLFFTYSNRKLELQEIMWYIKFCIFYFISVLFYFIYQIQKR